MPDRRIPTRCMDTERQSLYLYIECSKVSAKVSMHICTSCYTYFDGMSVLFCMALAIREAMQY